MAGFLRAMPLAATGLRSISWQYSHILARRGISYLPCAERWAAIRCRQTRHFDYGGGKALPAGDCWPRASGYYSGSGYWESRLLARVPVAADQTSLRAESAPARTPMWKPPAPGKWRLIPPGGRCWHQVPLEYPPPAGVRWPSFAGFRARPRWCRHESSTTAARQLWKLPLYQVSR